MSLHDDYVSLLLLNLKFRINPEGSDSVIHGYPAFPFRKNEGFIPKGFGNICHFFHSIKTSRSLKQLSFFHF